MIKKIIAPRTRFYNSIKHFKFFMVFTLLFSSVLTINAQLCSCTIQEVQQNTVTPCNVTIGKTVTVSTTSEIRNAINQANSSGGNMTILSAEGSYQIASSTSYPYITGNNIVIKSLSGKRDQVILSGGGMKPTSSTENVLGIAGNHITIADLTIQDCGNHGIQVSGHHLFVHNVHFKNTYEQMLKGATDANRIDSAIVQCSLFEYPNGIGPNYYIGGLDIHKGTNWTVRDNMFKNIKSPSGSVAEHAIHFWNQSSDNLIERNVIINCDRGIGFGLGNSPSQGGIIRNNMIYNDGLGVFSDVGIGLENSPNTKVYNNTIFVAYQNAIEYRFAGTTNVDIRNNLTNKSIRSRDGGSGVNTNNVTNAQSNWFVNTSAGDLHLSSGLSNVVDQGIDLMPYITDDIDQNKRPQGINIDIGADEYIIKTNQKDIFNSSLDFQILPNPSSSGVFKLVKSNKLFSDTFNLSVHTLFGQQIYETELGLNQSNIEINLAANPKGVYLLKLEYHNSIHCFKLVKL
ncbi:MAG: right-handed parallel beta-helix repeat-containing protein [Saprospiraceae bacterium]